MEALALLGRTVFGMLFVVATTAWSLPFPVPAGGCLGIPAHVH